MIYLLSFYTEGPDIDGCYDLTNTSIKIRDNLSKYFTDIFLFNKRTLKELPNSENFCNSYEEELDMNPNANKIGYFDFKGLLIDYILKKIPEHAKLIYHDANFEKNIQYWESNWPEIENISKKLLDDNQSDIFFQFEREGVYLKEYVKTYTIDKLFPNVEENMIVKDCILINAARMIIKNTDFSHKFIKDYMDLCQNKDLIMKSPNPNPHIEFKWSCGDQDVLNCLIYRYIFDGKLKPNFPIYSFLYRVLRYENRPFIWFERPHWTGISTLYNTKLIEYMKKK
jgi:hypothetical protein